MKNAVDKGKIFGALLTDLFMAFDCLNHELLIVKLNIHGSPLPALEIIHNYLSNRKQRVQVNSLWQEMLCGVPQGSILGSLLFNIFPEDFFYIK